ncbi:RNA-guided endonuclease IscB [Sporosarcina ureilytica]|uniref:HNH endonuclease n=1 Tax=Sporosarcina ureilytica TaxID=298596 RepID=A0A1D8JEL4_9BACL|nr:RNA-guided endonuclease IscB [Sporosarcina ureilytica]AOV07123.1 HNH endonuclease [Sporosarcina ureilytica]
MFVYVLNQYGKPLMPCKPIKARKLLTQGKAKVVQRTPFTIQLKYGSSGYVQPVSLGIDAGTKEIGISATTKDDVVFEGEVKLRTDIQELLATRKSLRGARRSRKTRYRKPRFLNRKKEKGWLAPSVQNKVDMHVKIIRKVHKILPIQNLTIEVAQFDIQKIKNPSISGDLYQKGDQLDFWNVREYVFFRDKHVCQYCKGKSKDYILNVHHIESRKTGGDSPDNLITLCENCHKKIHREGKEYLFKRKNCSFRDATQMTVMRWFIYDKVKELYPHARLTYGFQTKNNRIRHGLDKGHAVDARCISGNPLTIPSENSYSFKQVRKNNRQLHKMTISKGGYRRANKAERFVKGFQLFDKVIFEGVECFIFGRRKTGYFDLRTLDGTHIHKSASFKKLRVIEKANTLLASQI